MNFPEGAVSLHDPATPHTLALRACEGDTSARFGGNQEQSCATSSHESRQQAARPRASRGRGGCLNWQTIFHFCSLSLSSRPSLTRGEGFQSTSSFCKDSAFPFRIAKNWPSYSLDEGCEILTIFSQNDGWHRDSRSSTHHLVMVQLQAPQLGRPNSGGGKRSVQKGGKVAKRRGRGKGALLVA